MRKSLLVKTRPKDTLTLISKKVRSSPEVSFFCDGNNGTVVTNLSYLTFCFLCAIALPVLMVRGGHNTKLMGLME